MPLPPGTLLNINCPPGEAEQVEIAKLGKRIYRDELKLTGSGRATGARSTGSTVTTPAIHEDPGTDFAAIGAGHISVTPLHFDLTDTSGMDALDTHDLARLLLPIVQERE